jgi:TolA-binding protein
MLIRVDSFWRRWLALAALALALGIAGVAQSRAASPAENRAWAAARTAFDEAKSQFGRTLADNRFSDFMKKYPASEYYDMAVVYRVRLMFDEGDYDGVITSLKSQAGRASNSADLFTYWTARAYAQKKNFEAAADAYARLVRENTNSPLRLEALFGEAEAHATLEYWPRVIEELGETNGAFQLMAATNRDNDLVVHGLLLLGEAQLKQRAYAAAEQTLTSVVTDHSTNKELEWDRQALLCQVRMGAGHGEEAVGGISNLLALANAANRPDLKARTFVLEGEMHEGLRQVPEAIRDYENNLSSEVPLERRQALLNIVELDLEQDQLADAAQRLKDFLAKHPEEKGADLNHLLLGELQLRQYYQPANANPAGDTETNHLVAAQTEFETLLKTFTNSSFAGKAELDLGWCLLAQTNIAGSEASFTNAIARLPFSGDQAVAHLKLGDLLYQQSNFGGALGQYLLIVTRYDSLPVVKNELLERVLYAIVRSALDEKNPDKNLKENLKTAEEAMGRIIALFPGSPEAERSLLLVGQEQNPAEARATFARFAALFPQSPLLPDVKLALARADERDANWTDAVAQFTEWVQTYTNHPALPRAEFSRAWATYKAGDETNAFALFTNFLARFQTNQIALGEDLPARAQFWVGDYYFRQGDYQKAEGRYEAVYEYWPQSELAFQARMSAGRAAVERASPATAISYFTNLSANSKCPPELAAQALFAAADATVALGPGAETNKYNNFSDAIGIFRVITDMYTNSPIAPLALGRLGVCYYALAGSDPTQYGRASNAFDRVMNSERADASTRSMAEVWLGKTLAAQAGVPPGADPNPKPMLVEALGHFLNVVHGFNLRPGEPADPYWVKEAGLESGKLAEELGEWQQAIESYEVLKTILPPLQASLDKKIANARQKLADAKK